jgi:hypothetical protein
MVRRIPLIAVLTVVLASIAGSALAAGFLPVKGNPADKLVAVPIDGYRYDNAKDCRKHPTKGAEAMVAWLQNNAGGSFWGIMRCERWGNGRASLHAEGRAIDWHLDVHNPADKREATRLIDLMLAPDRAGNLHALARRMGVQEIIWNCTSWFSGSGSMRPYSACYDGNGKRKKIDDTTAHRDHIHFGLNWPGAKLRTTFWSQGR